MYMAPTTPRAGLARLKYSACNPLANLAGAGFFVVFTTRASQ
jgi:hypothetical protein